MTVATLFTLGVLTLLLGAERRAEAYCSGSAAKNLRILTYNVHGLPPYPGNPDGNEDVYQMTDKDRMTAIANEILAQDADVVVLNEVWQEDDGGKDTFVSKLGKKYPHFIRYVRGRGEPEYTIDGKEIPGGGWNDSGLMLFSKDPFAKFSKDVPFDTRGFVGFEACNGSNASGCVEWGPLHAKDEVAVHTFALSEANGWDAYAAKAFVFVRIQGACAYNVGFTHSNSGEDLEDMNARTAQFAKIKGVIDQSLTTSQKDYEPIFLLGDLNVDGNLAPLPHQTVLHANGSGSTEYGVQFDAGDPHAAASAAFFSCKQPANTGVCRFSQGGKLLTDAWAYETSPTDYGQTAHGRSNDSFDFNFVADAGQRLDYVFHSNPVGADGGLPFLCTQHIARAFELVDPPLSDHMMVRADFNGSYARCNAREKYSASNPSGPSNGAEVVVFDATGNQTIMDGNTKLRYPGSGQWYIVKDRGTFSVAVTDPLNVSTKIGAAVYHHSDLSRQKPTFHKEMVKWTPNMLEAKEVKAYKYQLDDPPYYVHVYGMLNATLTPDDADFLKEDRAYPSVAGGKDYRVHFHMSRCASLADACSFTAGVLRDMVWPDKALNTDDMAYFTFYTDAALTSNGQVAFPKIQFLIEPHLPDLRDGFDQDVRFYLADSYNDQLDDCAYSPQPCNQDLGQIISGWSHPADLGGLSGWNETVGLAVSGALPPIQVGTPTRYLLKIGRPYDNLDFTETLRYETSLTYFMPQVGNTAMTCNIQQSILGDDQIGLKVQFDAGEPRVDCSQSSCPELSTPTAGPASYVGQFDDGGTQRTVGEDFGGPFIEYVLPSLYEDVLNGDDFEYLVYGQNASTSEDPMFYDPHDDWRDEAKIFPLSPTEGGDAVDSKPRVFTWCGEQGGSNVPASESITYPLYQCPDAEFWYTMGYTLSHDNQRK